MKRHLRFLLIITLASATNSALGAPPLPPPLAPNEALQELKVGNQRFVSGQAGACSNVPSTRAQLTKSQTPDAIVLSCSDSRVPPEQVFDQGLGKIFTTRVAGNILDEDTIASIEYAITHLGTRLIVVLGHDSCGAVKAALTTPADKDAGSPSLNHLLSEIRTNLGGMVATEPNLRGPVKKNVSAVASSLSHRSKIVQDAVSSGKVRIVQAVYDLETGKVIFWD